VGGGDEVPDETGEQPVVLEVPSCRSEDVELGGDQLTDRTGMVLAATTSDRAHAGAGPGRMLGSMTTSPS
jgi:hypothetical protein